MRVRNTLIRTTEEVNESGYSPTFLAAVKGASAWSREARALLTLAAALGVKLDEQALIWDDVHDLRSRRDALTWSGQ
jgi:hypothetical protein